MKTTRNQFERTIEQVNENNNSIEALREDFKAIFESDKEFTQKCDYIAHSLLSLDIKIASIDEEIDELKNLKSKLKLAKEIALTTGAEVMSGYGIEKLEGLRVSSITITTPSTKEKLHLTIYDEMALIKQGYFKVIVDEDGVKKAFGDVDERKLIESYCSLDVVSEPVLAKLRINKKRNQSNNPNFKEIPQAKKEVA